MGRKIEVECEREEASGRKRVEEERTRGEAEVGRIIKERNDDKGNNTDIG